MNSITIDEMIAFLVGVLVSGMVFFYFYSKLYSLKEEIKAKALEYYYENKSLKSFEELAEKTLQNSSQNLIKNSYDGLNILLKPFQKEIEEFNHDIKNYYILEAKERFALKKELEGLQELNYKLLNESNRLTNALRSDNKFAGSWGEFVLESILDSSGLRKGYEYETQVDFKLEEGRYRPDVIVHLPLKRDIIIDSKVSLKAYERYINDADEEALKEHINSIKTHIQELSKKEYHKLIDGIDLVLLFIPIEGAYIESIRHDKKLFNYAYSKNIILVSPTTLITVLKTVEYSWKKEFQNKNAQKITQKASKLYDKFQSFIDDMKMVDSSLKKAQNSYESAFKKLSSGNANLIKQAKELKELENVFES
jgi:DNA recombination protein RmuC